MGWFHAEGGSAAFPGAVRVVVVASWGGCLADRRKWRGCELTRVLS
jgi:hypothetical protein